MPIAPSRSLLLMFSSHYSLLYDHIVVPAGNCGLLYGGVFRGSTSIGRLNCEKTSEGKPLRRLPQRTLAQYHAI